MHVCRTRFKKDVVTEFMVPRNKRSGKVMIFCGGVPGVPHKDEVLDFWAREGYWTFFPRYRGTWESSGTFLKESPEKVIFDVLECLPNGFKDYWSSKDFCVRPEHVTVVGSSFGGPAAILSTLDPRVNKAIGISPVVDWIAEDKADPIDNLYRLLKEVYGGAYRLHKAGWSRLKSGTFYNPSQFVKQLDGRKLFIFHAQNDQVVRYDPVLRFSKEVGCQLVTFKRGGHLSSTLLMQAHHTRRIRKFLKS